MDTHAPPTGTAPRRLLQSTALATLVVLLVLLGFALLLSLRNVLASVFLGLLLATALRPLMSRLQEGHVPRFVAASVAMLLLVGSIVGLIVLILPLATSQIGSISAALPQLYAGAREWMIDSRLRLFRQIGYRLDPELSSGGPEFEGLFGPVLESLPTAGYLAFVVIATFVFAYYWLFYRERSLRGLLLLLPMEQRTGAESVWLQIEGRIGGYIRGQLLLALITGALSLLAYWVAGVPFAVLLAVIAGVLELVPFIGPFIATGLAVAVGLSVSTETALAALVAGIIVQQLENNVLAPRIMDEAAGVSPVVTLLAFGGFAALFGAAGALLAIPLAATLQVLFGAWLERRSSPADPAVEGRGSVDRLRYAVREMSSDIAGHLRAKDGAANAELDRQEEELERIVRDLDTLLAGENDSGGLTDAPAITLGAAR